MRRIWPFRNFGLKLLAVAVALLLWLSIAGEETVERGLRVPLELQQMPPGLEWTSDVPTTVDVRVRGATGTLSRVSPGDVVAVLDLRSARAGRRLFPLTPDQVRAPFGVSVAQISPSAVAIVFEPTAVAKVPVVPAVDGLPAAGFMVGAKRADPPSVDVVGPESAVKRATEAVTEPVSVAGAHEEVRQTAIVGLLDPTLRLKSVRSATVTVQIVAAPLERVLRSRAVHLRGTGPNLDARAEPSTVDVTLRGSREAMSRLDVDEVVAYVDLANLGVGQYQQTVHAIASREVGVTKIDPSTVSVRISNDK